MRIALGFTTPNRSGLVSEHGMPSTASISRAMEADGILLPLSHRQIVAGVVERAMATSRCVSPFFFLYVVIASIGDMDIMCGRGLQAKDIPDGSFFVLTG